MTNLFGEPLNTKPKKPIDKKRRNWENRFQRWSNNEALDGLTSLGKCGYGYICDYCNDNSYGRPCVRALNSLLKEKQISLNYDSACFDDVWTGRYFKGEQHD